MKLKYLSSALCTGLAVGYLFALPGKNSPNRRPLAW